ncbi:MAG: M20/M25/M40 family metallo-hydrolase [Rhodospirillales bacterium]|jgi:acetylornithine deacetylase/succinyl-diaminopimelate desuccinylase-like protein|nr:M20/M25/M40 family metallo-hydrolase [Rhodospirillales bacterium]
MPNSSLDESALAGELTSILGDLIALPSDFPPGDTRKICAYAAERFRGSGYDTAIETKTEPIANVVARRGDGKPCLVFNAHADTVGVGNPDAWTSDPLRAVVRDGRLYGLGAANCKGSMAVHLWLAEEVARRGGPKKGELVFTFAGDEEDLGPGGTCYLRQSGLVKPDILIVGATTENQLITAERGVLWVKITARGQAAHAGDPASGDNAIERMMRLLAAVQTRVFADLGERRDGAMASTANIGTFHSGHNINVVPSECTVEIDRRLLPGETVEEAFGEIRDAVEAAGEPPASRSVELLRGTNGFKGAEDGRAVGAFRAAIEARTGAAAQFLTPVGAYDGRYFADDDIEIVNVGPGAGAEGHATNESVPVTQLVDAAVIHLDVVERLLGLNG